MPKPKKDKKRIVLLDTHAIIHRAYHALPDFTGPTGAPTGALYGLVTMLLKTVNDLAPDYIAACYDLAGPTIRHEAYEGYKATRAKTDDALSAQIDESRKVFQAFSIPIYEKEGFEADDMLGTIAAQIKDETDVIIASGDMDMLQCIDDAKVRVFTLKRGLNDTILYDEKGVKERFGFGPALIPDWKGLRGDPSDNIKGVPGIGEKTATELITQFGTIEQIYKKLAAKGGEAAFLAKGIKLRIIGLLREHEEAARFSKSLATIRCDAPIAFQLPSSRWCEHVDAAKALAMCDEFGFRSLRERVKTTLAKAAGKEVYEEPEEGFHFETAEEVDPQKLSEAGVMLWLLCSDFTNPALDDILAYTKKRTLADAHVALTKELSEAGRVQEVYDRIEKPLIPIVREMGAHGVRIDTKVLKELRRRYSEELKVIEADIFKMVGREFNISSPKQLGDILFDVLKIVPDRMKKTSGGQRSTRESELEKIRDQHPIIDQVLEYRELKKLLGTYIENLPAMLDAHDRLHAQFLQTGAVTGRMASQNPGMQNIPLRTERGRAIRHAFVASNGFTLLALDYSQIELRLAAILSGDKKLCEIFISGRDVHQEVAARVFHVPSEEVDAEMRRRAKVINFGILYGMGINALRAQLGTTTAEAHQFYDEYFAQFKELSEYLEKTKGFARKHGYTETLFGRRRQFPEMKSPLPYVRAQAERMAINAPIQGTQADLIKLAMVSVNDMLEKEGLLDDAHLLLQVHDELVYEVKNEKLAELAPRIQSLMEGALADKPTCGVPIEAVAKTGPNWGDMKPI